MLGKMASRDRVAQAKSRAERSRPPTVPVPQVDIVPGRLSEAEWLSLLAAEEAEDGVGDFLAGLLEQVLQGCYRVHLARQCIPYVIHQAREAMLQIIEWRFLVRDEGQADVSADPTWQEDGEPVACITDSWAQGSVPVLQAMSHPEEEEVPPAAPPEEVAAPQEVPCDMGAMPPRVEELSWQPSQEEAQLVKGLPVSPLESSSLRQASASFKARGGGPPVRGSRNTTWLQSHEVLLCQAEKHLLLRGLSQDSVEERACRVPQGPHPLLPPSCSNLLRIQLGRPPTIKDVLYDEVGNITAVPRLDPARLPKRWVKPSVEIVDPDAESLRQEVFKTGPGHGKQRFRPKAPWAGANIVDRLCQVGLGAGPARASRKWLPEQTAPQLPPPGRTLEPTSLIYVKPTLLMETMELAPGVAMRGRGSTGQGARLAAPPEERETAHKELKPISSRLPFLPTVAVEKVAQEPRVLPRMAPGPKLLPGGSQLSRWSAPALSTQQ